MSGKSKKSATELKDKLPDGEEGTDETVLPCKKNKDPQLKVKVFALGAQSKRVYGAATVKASALTKDTVPKSGIADFSYVAVGRYEIKVTGVGSPWNVDVGPSNQVRIIDLKKGDKETVEIELLPRSSPLIRIDRKVIAVNAVKRTLNLTADRPFSGKGTLTCLAGADKLKFWRGSTRLDLVGGKLEFADISESGVSLDLEGVEFSSLEGVHLKWELSSDTHSVGPAVEEKLTVVKATLSLYKKSGAALDPAEKSGSGRVILLQDASKSRSRAKLTVTCEPAEYQGTLVIEPIVANVRLFDAEQAGKQKTPLPLEIPVGAGQVAAMWVEGSAVSAVKCDSGFKLSIKDVADEVDRAVLTVVDVRIDLYKAGNSATASQILMTAVEKQEPGRLLLKQSAKFTRQRAKMCLVKLPHAAPCNLVLRANNAKVKLFPSPNERHVNGELPVNLPKTFAPNAFVDDTGVRFWAEGAELTSLREAEFTVDVTDIDDACDKACLSVVDITADNGNDPAPRLMPNKNAHNQAGNHHIAKVRFKHALGAGSVKWSTTSTKFALSNDTTHTVTVTSGAQPSASLDAECLQVVFTPSGKDALPAVEHWMTVVKVVFSESPNQSYGYDDMDDSAMATDELHHVSVKKNGSTKVRVVIEGGATSELIVFKSASPSKADVQVPAAGETNFDLVIDGKNTDKGEAAIYARVNGDTGPICDGIRADVYKEKVVDISVALVADSNVPATALHLAFDAAGTETAIRSWYKRAVATINIFDRGAIDSHYDSNSNGALDIRAGGGNSPEVNQVSNDVSGAGLKVIIVRELAWLYYLGAAAAVGDTTITIGNGTMKFITADSTYDIGSGATLESITVASVAGNVVTIKSPLTKNHTTADALKWPLSGLSGNPIWVQESGKNAAMVRRTIAHEVGHSALVYVDVDDPTNMMHFSASRTDTRLRYLKRVKKYDPGEENQWDVCKRT